MTEGFVYPDNTTYYYKPEKNKPLLLVPFDNGSIAILTVTDEFGNKIEYKLIRFSDDGRFAIDSNGISIPCPDGYNTWNELIKEICTEATKEPKRNE